MATLPSSGYYEFNYTYSNPGFQISLTQTLNTSNRTSTFQVKEMRLYTVYYQYHWFTGTVKLGGSTIYTASAQNGDTGCYADYIDQYNSLTVFKGSHTPLTKTHNADGSLGALTLTVDFTIIGGDYSSSTNSRGSINGSVSISPSTMEKQTFTVSYNANGGSTTPSAQSFTAGGGVYLSGAIAKASSTSSTVFTVTGDANGGSDGSSFNVTKTSTTPYSFSQWKASNGTTYAGGAYYNAQASTTMTAQWTTGSTTTTYSDNSITKLTNPSRANTTDATYVISFNNNGGDSTHSDLTAKKTSSYSFKGWGSSKNSTSVLSSSTTFTQATTVYALWNQSTATESVTLPTPTRDGYIFKGWSKNATALSGITGTYTPTETATFYAIWEEQITDTNTKKMYPYIKGGELLNAYIDTSDGWKEFNVTIGK